MSGDDEDGASAGVAVIRAVIPDEAVIAATPGDIARMCPG